MRTESASLGTLGTHLRGATPPIRWTPLALSAFVLGGIVAAMIPLVDHIAVTFEVLPIVSTSSRVDLENELRIIALRTPAGEYAGSVASERLWTEKPSAERLRVTFATSDHTCDGPFVGDLGERFRIHLAELAAELRRTPSAAESILGDLLALHHERLREVQTKLDAAAAGLPPSDPRVNREALRMRWETLQAAWTTVHDRAIEATKEAERLRSQPDLDVGMVSADERRQALESDAALQQDLKELTVRLTEIKLHLLNVWQQSAGRLDELRIGSEAFGQTLDAVDPSALPSEITEATGRIRMALSAYRGALDAFGTAWTAEFTAIQRMEVDPRRADILDIQERVRTLLNDFLFAGSRHLETLRTQLAELGRNPSATSRHYVLESNVTRGFQVVQSAHHRFEFAASALDTPENFRLDASLRSARGLRRRSLERTQGIEIRLEKEAAVRARQQRVTSIAQAEKTAEQLRAASERTLTDLFDVQGGLLAAGSLTEDFLRSALGIEVLAQKVQTQQDDLALIEARRRELEDIRGKEADTLRAEFLSCEVLAYDFQWSTRIRVGLTGAVAAFVAMIVLRRFVDRRAES